MVRGRGFDSRRLHQYTKVNSSLLAFFLARSRVFAGTPADSCGLPSPAVSPISAPFRSLLAILLSSLARRLRAEVRRGRNVDLYRSMGYVLTNQTVGLRHRQAKETMAVVFCR